MDPCFVDVTLEFLGVVFHSILYYTGTYPESIFETRKKYNIVVYRSRHPEINSYIESCLKSIAECLKTTLQRVEFAITDNEYNPLIKFMFDFQKNSDSDTSDAYLINCEQSLRAFCLKLASMKHKFTDLPEDRSFTIFIHTNESTAVTIATNSDLEEFPLVEVDRQKEADTVIPLRRLKIRNHTIDTFVEII